MALKTQQTTSTHCKCGQELFPNADHNYEITEGFEDENGNFETATAKAVVEYKLGFVKNKREITTPACLDCALKEIKVVVKYELEFVKNKREITTPALRT